ncbi:hypothetical protein CPC197_0509A, partial [Chlamydia psittaci C1/97]
MQKERGLYKIKSHTLRVCVNLRTATMRK